MSATINIKRIIGPLAVLSIVAAIVGVAVGLSYASFTQTRPGVAADSYISIGATASEYATDGLAPLNRREINELEESVQDVVWFYAKWGEDNVQVTRQSGKSIEAMVEPVSNGALAELNVDMVRGDLLFPSQQLTAVLSKSLWETMFQPTENVLEHSLTIEHEGNVPISGVVSDAFRGILTLDADIWLIEPTEGPASLRERNYSALRNLHHADKFVFGKLRSTTSIEQIRSAVHGFQFINEISLSTQEQIAQGRFVTMPIRPQEFTDMSIRSGFYVYPYLGEKARQGSVWLLVVATLMSVLGYAMVLAINAHELQRRPIDLFVHVSVGATPALLAMGVLRSNALALLIFVLIAVALFWWLQSIMLSFEPFSSFPYVLNAPAIAVAIASVVALMLLTLASTSIHAGSRVVRGVAMTNISYGTRSQAWGRRVLLTICVASTVFSISSVHYLYGFVNFPFGFANHNVIAINVLTMAKDELVRDKISALPQVRSVSMAAVVPLLDALERLGGGERLTLHPELEQTRFYKNHVTASFFDTLGVRTIAGNSDLGVAKNDIVVSRTTAELIADRAEDVVGRSLQFTRSGYEPKNVIAVVEDVRYAGYESNELPWYYELAPESSNMMTILVDYTGTSDQLWSAIRNTEELEGLRFMAPFAIKNLLEEQFLLARGGNLLRGILGLIVLSVSAVAVHWLLWKLIDSRKHRIAVQVALGITVGRISVDQILSSVAEVVYAVAIACSGFVALRLIAPHWIEDIALWQVLPAILIIALWFALTIHLLVLRLASVESVSATLAETST